MIVAEDENAEFHGQLFRKSANENVLTHGAENSHRSTTAGDAILSGLFCGGENSVAHATGQVGEPDAKHSFRKHTIGPVAPEQLVPEFGIGANDFY